MLKGADLVFFQSCRVRTSIMKDALHFALTEVQRILGATFEVTSPRTRHLLMTSVEAAQKTDVFRPILCGLARRPIDTLPRCKGRLLIPLGENISKRDCLALILALLLKTLSSTCGVDLLKLHIRVFSPLSTQMQVVLLNAAWIWSSRVGAMQSHLCWCEKSGNDACDKNCVKIQRGRAHEHLRQNEAGGETPSLAELLSHEPR